jgi:hypothetical protein
MLIIPFDRAKWAPQDRRSQDGHAGSDRLVAGVLAVHVAPSQCRRTFAAEASHNRLTGSEHATIPEENGHILMQDLPDEAGFQRYVVGIAWGATYPAAISGATRL